MMPTEEFRSCYFTYRWYRLENPDVSHQEAWQFAKENRHLFQSRPGDQQDDSPPIPEILVFE